jgi:hypothetical protein
MVRRIDRQKTLLHPQFHRYDAPETNVCPQCEAEAVRPTNLREELVRLAGKWDCPIEVVDKSGDLAVLGGVGCLLRSRPDLQRENLAAPRMRKT